MIENVKEFCPKLKLEPLREGKILGRIEPKIPVRGEVQDISAGISKRSECRLGKRRGIKPLLCGSLKSWWIRISHQFSRLEGPRTHVCRIARYTNGERQTRLHGDYTANVPAPEEC